jgi:uncharacterized protein (DUF58 family)
MSETLGFPLLPRRRVAGVTFGAMRARSRGPGHDLAGTRPYRPGDDVRRIDWRSSARLSLARENDELILREHLTEESTRVVVVADPAPSMALYPPELPWLSKPEVVEEATEMILASALRAGCRTLVAGEGDGAPEARPATLAAGLVDLARRERGLPPGTFVFVLSDFLCFPPDDVWQQALARDFDLVPVVIQDPVWEQSFPDVAGAVLPLADPATGRVAHVCLSQAEVRARREENEARLRDILSRLDLLGLDHVLVSSHDRGRVLESFLDWAAGRHQGARLAR